MTDEGSITAWIGRLANGERSAAEHLWQRYAQRLVRLARAKLRNAPRGVADEEDVALSAFDSFCRATEEGRFPDLANREDLWALLMTITARKVFHAIRDQQRHKRGGLMVRAAEDAALQEALAREPDPALAAEMAEDYQRLLDCLPDAKLRSVALWKMEGQTVEQIAANLKCSARSVKRKTQLIRDLWDKEIGR
jgi:RNA polymerase sigma factor (sigma-70 family)